MTTAWRTPRAIRTWKTPYASRREGDGEDRVALAQAGKNAPSVVIVNTRKKTLPATLPAQ